MEWLTHSWQFFVKGGVLMWPLLACSLVSLTIVLERLAFFRREDSGRDYPKQFCDLLRQGAGDKALELSRKTNGEAAALGVRLLSAPAWTARQESYVTGESRQVLSHLEKGLNYLSVIVTLAPILGLMGTITGMMASFQALGARWENPLAVTAGVAEAMITTIFGLAIAIFTICFHTYFSQKLRMISLELEQMDNTFLENAGRKQGGKGL